MSGAADTDAGARDRVLTLPNLLSLGRLLCVPLFCWLLFGADEPIAAFVLLAVLGATDWVDGWIARRYDQVSEVGKVLDPTADRIVLITAAIALVVDGSVPLVVGIVVLVREVLISAAVLVLAAEGAPRIDVEWVGKLGTFLLMFAFPTFLLADSVDTLHDLLLAIAWGLAIAGLVASYWALVRYVPLARAALREARPEDGATPAPSEGAR